ncbi:MAG: response regulator [Dehalococcoidia bacterium]
MESKATRILLIEDSPEDTWLIQRMMNGVKVGAFEMECAGDLSAGLDRVDRGGIDALLLDLTLPDSRGLDTLVKARARVAQMPIIVLTGLEDEETGIRALHVGAQDYLVKGQVDSNLLARCLKYAIERKQVEWEREQLIAQLQDALAQVKQLSGLLSICMTCKKIRDDEGDWNKIEYYIAAHSEAEFTHGICPECIKASHPQLYARLVDDPVKESK